jgi:hypothetical protein
VYYRLRQFWQGLHAQVSPEEKRRVADLLPAPAVALFGRMPVDAQRHSLNVLYGVQKAGNEQRDLAVAALLHDAGKVAAEDAGVHLGLWLRGPLVLLEHVAPQLLRRWAADDRCYGWRYALYVHLEHPRLGAEQAAACGCSPLACWLIEHHQERQPVVAEQDPRYTLLRLLQEADGDQ